MSEDGVEVPDEEPQDVTDEIDELLDNEEDGDDYHGTRELTVERSTATAHRLSRYDGVCGNVHGHNIEWEVELHIEMTGDSHNMPLDFKDVADLLDRFDHALTVAYDDEMLEIDPVWGGVKDDTEFPVEYQSEVYGQVWVFEGDPTCEVLSQYVADELASLETVHDVDVTAWETDKYGMSAHSW